MRDSCSPWTLQGWACGPTLPPTWSPGLALGKSGLLSMERSQGPRQPSQELYATCFSCWCPVKVGTASPTPLIPTVSWAPLFWKEASSCCPFTKPSVLGAQGQRATLPETAPSFYFCPPERDGHNLLHPPTQAAAAQSPVRTNVWAGADPWSPSTLP